MDAMQKNPKLFFFMGKTEAFAFQRDADLFWWSWKLERKSKATARDKGGYRRS